MLALVCSLKLFLSLWLPNGMESPALDSFGSGGRHMELTSLESPIRLHNSGMLDPSNMQKTDLHANKQTNKVSFQGTRQSLIFLFFTLFRFNYSDLSKPRPPEKSLDVYF